jgi:hypothetical protein
LQRDKKGGAAALFVWASTRETEMLSIEWTRSQFSIQHFRSRLIHQAPSLPPRRERQNIGERLRNENAEC